MKRKALGTLVLATVGVAVLATGCGEKKKLPTVKELYDANKNLAENIGDKKVDGKLTAELGATVNGDTLATLGITAGTKVGLSVNMDLSAANGITYVKGTYSVEAGAQSQSDSVENWTDKEHSYTLDSATNTWSVSDKSAEDEINDLTSKIGMGDIEKYIDDLQKEIDDKKNENATLELEDDVYVLTYKLPLSELADVDGAADYAKQANMDLSSLKGNIVMSAKFDSETLFATYFDLSMDSEAMQSIESAAASLVDVKISACKISFSANYGSGSLTIPDDVKNAETEPVATETQEPVVPTTETETETLGGGTAPADGSLLSKVFGDTITDEASFLTILGADKDTDVAFTTATGENWTLSSATITKDLYYVLANYTETKSMVTDCETMLQAGENEDAAMMLIAAMTAMGMQGSDATNDLTELSTYIVSNCKVIDATNLTTAMSNYASSLSQ